VTRPDDDDPFARMFLPLNWVPLRHEPGRATVLGVEDTPLRIELCLDLYEEGLGETLVLYDVERGQRPTREDVDEAFVHYVRFADIIEVPSPRDYPGARAFMLRDVDGNLPIDVSAPPEQVELMAALLARLRRSIEKQVAVRVRGGAKPGSLAVLLERRLDGEDRALVGERGAIATMLRGYRMNAAIVRRVEEPCEHGVHAVFVFWRGATMADVGYQIVDLTRRATVH
jgi:hypothetical protein